MTELRDGLRFTLTMPPSRQWALIFGAAALCACGGGVIAWFSGLFPDIFLALFAACFLASMSYRVSRTRWIVLDARNVEFRCGSASIARASIERFAWERGGRSRSYGLYAKSRYSQTCIFPGLPEAYSADVVEAIYKRFPDTRGQDRFNPGAPDSLTLLRLNS